MKNFEEKELEVSPKIKLIAKNFLLELLNSDKPILSPRLERMFSLTSPEVRTTARYLRRNHYPVGSSTRGYFYAKDVNSWNDAKNFMRNKIISMLGTLREMKRVDTNKTPTLFPDLEITPNDFKGGLT